LSGSTTDVLSLKSYQIVKREEWVGDEELKKDDICSWVTSHHNFTNGARLWREHQGEKNFIWGGKKREDQNSKKTSKSGRRYLFGGLTGRIKGGDSWTREKR